MKKLDKDIELNRELHRICNMDLPESELIDKKIGCGLRPDLQEGRTGKQDRRKEK